MLTWRCEDIWFTDAQVRAAQGVVERLGDVELAFLAGSLAVGLGHGTSDVDLYVVCAGQPENELAYEHDGVIVHVNPLSAAKVMELVAIADVYRTTGADRSQSAMDVKTLHALVRLATGQRLRASAKWQHELNPFDHGVVRQILVVRNSNIASAFAEDVCGALASGDQLTAVTASALALESACEAALAAAGDLYVGPKFLYRRLARTLPAWCDRVFTLNNRDVSHDDIEHLTGLRLDAAAVLLAWCALEGWDGDLGALPAPPAEVTGARGPVRDVYFSPLRFADGLALVGPEDGFEVSEDVVHAWRELDGRPLSDVDPAITGVVAQLIAIGAARQPEMSGSFVRRAPHFSVHPKRAAV